MLVVAGIFADAAVRFSLIPDRTADGEPGDRSQAGVEQAAWQPVGVPGSYPARQLPDAVEVALVAQLQLASKRGM